MSNLTRILLYTICILIAPVCFAQEADMTAKNPELLDQDYVQIEVSNVNSVSNLAFHTFHNLTHFIQAKYYSLLNWKSHSRSSNLQIDNYNRLAQFGRWINDPNDDVCFNTRAKVLVRDSVKNVMFKDTNHCVVEKGVWDDPYTTTVKKNAQEIQIDHLVPLKNAYLSGAYKWNFKSRCLYANYLGEEFHLLSVDGIQNMKKGDRAPDRYMPPNQDYACTYVKNWLTVKMLWGLTMTPAEATAIHQIILDQRCSLSQLRISDAELRSQKKFAQDNIDLCDRISPPSL